MTPWNRPKPNPFETFGSDPDTDKALARRWAKTYVELYGGHPNLELTVDMGRIRRILAMSEADLGRELQIAKFRARLRGNGRYALAVFYELASMDVGNG